MEAHLAEHHLLLVLLQAVVDLEAIIQTQQRAVLEVLVAELGAHPVKAQQEALQTDREQDIMEEDVLLTAAVAAAELEAELVAPLEELLSAAKV